MLPLLPQERPLTSTHVKENVFHPVFQVKKLQMMLRQANDQLERTITEKQNLEDSVKVGNEETAAKVWNIVNISVTSRQ